MTQRELVANQDEFITEDREKQSEILDLLKDGIGGKELVIKVGRLLTSMDHDLLEAWLRTFPTVKLRHMHEELLGRFDMLLVHAKVNKVMRDRHPY